MSVRVAIAMGLAWTATPARSDETPSPAAPPQEAAPAPEAEAEASAEAPPSWRAGVGVGFPDGFPVELRWHPAGKSEWRFFATLPTIIKAKEEQAAERDVFLDAIVAATPATEVDVDVYYGPNVGFDWLHHPYGTEWFVGAGAYWYQVRATAKKSSILFLCFDVSKACNADDAEYQTEDEVVSVEATARIKGAKARLWTGWTFDAPTGAYVTAGLGAAITLWSKRSTSVSSALADDPALSPLVKDQARYVLDEKEDGLEKRVEAKMRATDRRVLPIALIAAGWSW
jgi:hypothetical protein